MGGGISLRYKIMSLESIDLEAVKKEIEEATKLELPKVGKLREKARALKLVELNYRQCHAIAPVATDGGDNRITFQPLNIEIIRVVDSEGREHVQKIVPLSIDPKIFKKFFEEIPVLKRMLERLKIKYEDVSYLLPKENPEEIDEDKIRGCIKTLREILEWAVLLDLAWNPGPAKVLLLRDGLLRTKTMKPETVAKLSKSFEEAYNTNGCMIIGIAKKSKVLNYLSLALELEGTFYKNYPCFCQVPAEIENESYNWDQTKYKTLQVFGTMHLVKFVEQKDGLVYPVDVPKWLMNKRKEVLEYAAETAKSSFPTIGYPYPLIKAHENAVLHGLEMDVLSKFMIDAVMENHEPKERDRILAHISLGRGLNLGGWKEYG
jgi:hypothetical protein